MAAHHSLWAEKLLEQNHINYKSPTLGHYQLLDVAPNIHNLMWYPASNKLRVNFINGSSKMVEMDRDKTLQTLKQYLR